MNESEVSQANEGLNVLVCSECCKELHSEYQGWQPYDKRNREIIAVGTHNNASE